MADCSAYSDWYSWIEKRVCAKGNLFGTLKYFGNTHFSDGWWCGIELDNPLGKNDGMVNNVRYFTCNSNFGIFIPVSKVTKLKDFPEDNFKNVANLNKTFEIVNISKNQIESNSVILDHKIAEEKLSNSGLGSTESLGILCLDLIDLDNSWENFPENCFNDFSNQQNLREKSSSSFSEPPAIIENELQNKIAYPLYASTPRVSKKKLVDYENDSDDSLDAKNPLPDKFTFDCQDFIFDVDKFKSNPNLTSTNKNLMELTSILNNPELSPILFGNKNVQQSENLENSKDFSKIDKFSQNSIEILCKTFELDNPVFSPPPCEKIFKNKNELNVTTPVEDMKSINLDYKKQNANGTFELKRPTNTSLIVFEEAKNVTFDLKETETKSFKSDSESKNELNATSDVENHNGNLTFELKQQKMPDIETVKKTIDSRQLTIENNSSNFNECGAITVADKTASLLAKTFIFDLSTIKECENSKILNESFNNKKEFLKETDSFQDSSTQSNYRNSICLPLSSCNKLQKSVRRTSSVSNYQLCKEKEKSLEMPVLKSSINRGRVSSIKNFHKNDNLFKKPFSPNSNLKNSKAILKSDSSLNTKENRNKMSSKESNNFPKKFFLKNTNNTTSVNSVCKSSDEIAFKSKHIKSSLNKDNKSDFCIPKSCSSSSSSKTVNKMALPLKNKLNCDNLKQSSSNITKFNSKTAPVNKITKNIITQTPTVTKIVHENSVKDNVMKTSKSQLKKLSLDKTFISKNDDFESLQKSSLPVTNFSSKLKIPKRNSLVPCFKDKLPVGVVKPRYSMHQAKNDVIPENLEIVQDKSSQNSNVLEKNLNEINLQSIGGINNSLKENVEAETSNTRPKKIKSLFSSPSNQKSESKQPLKKIGGIPTGLKIPRFSQNLKKR